MIFNDPQNITIEELMQLAEEAISPGTKVSPFPLNAPELTIAAA